MGGGNNPSHLLYRRFRRGAGNQPPSNGRPRRGGSAQAIHGAGKGGLILCDAQAMALPVPDYGRGDAAEQGGVYRALGRKGFNVHDRPFFAELA